LLPAFVSRHPSASEGDVTDGASTTWIYYIDESYDHERFCLTALGLKGATWRAAFEKVKEYRRNLKTSDGVLLRTEVHARELVRGRGKLGPQVLGKWRRSRIYLEMLELTAALPDAHLFNVCLLKTGRRDPQLDAWDRLLNRINRRCEQLNNHEGANRRNWLANVKEIVDQRTFSEIERRLVPYSSHALIIADRGREEEIVRLRRKLSVANFVPSKFGSWSGAATRNIPLTNLLEDIVFRPAAHSYFIQLADCAAFALLKRESAPTPQIRKYSVHRAFDLHLAGICERRASASDRYGIVRR
jgi:hypothetical protein